MVRVKNGLTPLPHPKRFRLKKHCEIVIRSLKLSYASLSVCLSVSPWNTRQGNPFVYRDRIDRAWPVWSLQLYWQVGSLKGYAPVLELIMLSGGTSGLKRPYPKKSAKCGQGGHGT